MKIIFIYLAVSVNVMLDLENIQPEGEGNVLKKADVENAITKQVHAIYTFEGIFFFRISEN